MSVENAMDSKTFSIIEAAAGRSYPNKDVVIYLDHEAAYQASLIEEKIAYERDSDKVNALDEEIQVLREKIVESELTVHMRGTSRGVRRQIEKRSRKVDDTDRAEFLTHENVAAHIIRVTDHEGNVDEHLFTGEEVQTLFDTLPDESVTKLLNAMNELTFEAMYFDSAVSADFLSRR